MLYCAISARIRRTCYWFLQSMYEVNLVYQISLANTVTYFFIAVIETKIVKEHSRKVTKNRLTSFLSVESPLVNE